MSAGDRDTLAALLAGHRMMPPSLKDLRWTCSAHNCDWTASDAFSTDARRRELFAAHVADVLLASDWLREQRAEAWDEGWKEHGIDSGSCTCQSCFFGYTDDRDRLNPYRSTTENTDAH